MKKLKMMALILMITIIMGCASQNNSQSISDAYDVVEQLDGENAQKQESSGESTITQETDGEKLSEGETIPDFTDNLPPRNVSMEVEFVESDEEILCNGFKFKVEDSVLVKNTDELDSILKEFIETDEDAKKFKQQIIDCGSIMENGAIRSGMLLLIKCRFENTTSSEKNLEMQMPLYEIKVSIDELKELAAKNNVTMNAISHIGQAQDFYGEHDVYIDPHIGIQTSDSSQYHLFQPGEVFETIFVMEIAEYVTGELCLSSGYLIDGSNMNFGAGTHIIPLDIR